MTINSIKLKNFRNYATVCEELSPSINLFLGENAQGKTNFLESVFFLSCLKTFHAKNERELIKFGENQAEIEADVTAHSRNMNLKIELSENAKRKIFENGILQKKLLDYIGTVKTVVFSPDDLYMVKEGPSVRRRFVNIAVSQLKPNYIQTLAEYNRILEHKNRLIKDDSKPFSKELLDVFNEKLAQAGAKIIKYRREFINELYNYAKIIHNEMSGGREDLSLKYITDRYVDLEKMYINEISSALLSHMRERTEAEREARMCLIGPHKDDIEILIDGKPAKFFASQGQIRTAVLAIKIAERDVFYRLSGETPILLLDDVLSELDANRQAYLLNKISKGQVIISSCNNHLFSKTENIKVFQVENGNITKTNCCK